MRRPTKTQTDLEPGGASQLADERETPRLPTRKEIAARAYLLYLERGRMPGHDVDDWLQAEYELMRLPLRVIVRLAPPDYGEEFRFLIRRVQTAMCG